MRLHWLMLCLRWLKWSQIWLGCECGKLVWIIYAIFHIPYSMFCVCVCLGLKVSHILNLCGVFHIPEHWSCGLFLLWDELMINPRGMKETKIILWNTSSFLYIIFYISICLYINIVRISLLKSRIWLLSFVGGIAIPIWGIPHTLLWQHVRSSPCKVSVIFVRF
jgi:hypothetical protein